MRIENYLNPYYPKTYAQLVHETNKCKRVIREEMSALKKIIPIVFSSSSNEGFRLVKPFEIMNEEELQKELLLIRRTASEINSRARDLDMQLRTYIAWIYDAEQELERRK